MAEVFTKQRQKGCDELLGVPRTVVWLPAVPPCSPPAPQLDRGGSWLSDQGPPTKISFSVGRCGSTAAGTPDFHSFVAGTGVLRYLPTYPAPATGALDPYPGLSHYVLRLGKSDPLGSTVTIAQCGPPEPDRVGTEGKKGACWFKYISAPSSLPHRPLLPTSQSP